LSRYSKAIEASTHQNQDGRLLENTVKLDLELPATEIDALTKRASAFGCKSSLLQLA